MINYINIIIIILLIIIIDHDIVASMESRKSLSSIGLLISIIINYGRDSIIPILLLWAGRHDLTSNHVWGESMVVCDDIVQGFSIP